MWSALVLVPSLGQTSSSSSTHYSAVGLMLRGTSNAVLSPAAGRVQQSEACGSRCSGAAVALSWFSWDLVPLFEREAEREQTRLG